MVLLMIGSAVYQGVNEYNAILLQKKNTLRIMALPIENELERVEQTMQELLNSNIAVQSLGQQTTNEQIYTNAYALRTAFQTVFDTCSELEMMMFYFPATNITLTKDNGFPSLTSSNKHSLITQMKASYVTEIQAETLPQNQWLFDSIGDRIVLRCNLNSQTVHCSAVFDLQDILQKIAESSTEDAEFFFMQDEIMMASWPQGSTIQISQDESGDVIYHVDQFKEIVVYEEVMGIELVYIIKNHNYFYSLGFFSVLVIVSVLLLFAMVIVLLMWQRQFVTPMNRLMTRMQQIVDGGTELYAIDGAAGKEIQQVNSTFNSVLERIQSLKIKRYEQALEMRQVQIQYYQAQIRPHFYLNCLKNIYSLSQQNEMKNIEQSILLLSNHLRYSFSWKSDTVSLCDELRMCQNYMELMGVTAVVKPRLQLDVDAMYLEAKVPPVSLLTLLENSFKYGLNTDCESVIRITAMGFVSEDKQYLQLGLYDNGIGFTQEQLEELNGLLDVSCTENQDHVGIRNVLMRFKLLYSDRFNMAFSNQNGGAVEFFIEQEGTH